MSASERRVLITGNEGFTGRHLTAELAARGFSVIPYPEREGDLRDPDAVRRMVQTTRPDYLVHLAGISFVRHGSPGEFYEVNTVGTTNLLDALASHGGLRKVVLASSSQVYGPGEADGIVETDACRPESHYACSKLAMEYMATTYGNRLPIVVVRPFNYTGVGQAEHFLVPKIVAHFARRAPRIELGNVDVVRDFSDVRGVIDVYARLLDAPVTGGVFNICSGRGRSLRSILEEAERLSGWRLEVRTRTDLVRAGEARRVVGSNARLVGTIGELRYQDFSETLRWMLESMRSGDAEDAHR